MPPPPNDHGGSSSPPRSSPGRDRGRDGRRQDRGDNRPRRDDDRDARRSNPRPRSRSRSRQRNYRSNRDRSRNGDRRDRHRSRSPGGPRSSRRDGRDRDERRSSRDRPRRPRSRSRSPRRPRQTSPPAVQRRGPLPSQADAFTTEVAPPGSGPPPPEKQKPNFKNTGRLAAESNTVQVQGGEGVVLKYHEPPEARKPPAKEPWRMYVFKGEDLVEMVELSERSCWLVGRERAVVDFPVDHPSCSKQHAALQFRYVEKRNEFGDKIGKVKPYLIDLESANGSIVNGDPIPPGRYVEVMDKDVIKFGLSSREYVLMLP
ncbi:hypothetical protein N7468_002598 [Penicillium chermesinum]|uniref:FHA domain-containing protein n=1 Tax=Penicillium chermesinum TaxID=63820 RepID=A0A9W9TXT0_9EURO|nr:uncharacterized protein N7468_002598 [Penicillium chermesinum]KAJ5247615.1 hypothetical protein N7468_002598 [Penicillium chermesinum]